MNISQAPRTKESNRSREEIAELRDEAAGSSSNLEERSRHRARNFAVVAVSGFVAAQLLNGYLFVAEEKGWLPVVFLAIADVLLVAAAGFASYFAVDSLTVQSIRSDVRREASRRHFADKEMEEIAADFLHRTKRGLTIHAAKGAWGSLSEHVTDAFWEHCIVNLAIGDLDENSGYLAIELDAHIKFGKIIDDTEPLRIRCVLAGEPQERIIGDPKNLLSWKLLARPGSERIPDKAFEIVSIATPYGPLSSVPDERASQELSQMDGVKDCLVFKIVKGGRTPVDYIPESSETIHFRVRVIQAACYGFVADYVSTLTESYSLTLDYEHASYIRDVHLIVGQASSGAWIYPEDAPRKKTISFPKWVLPRSSIVFAFDYTLDGLKVLMSQEELRLNHEQDPAAVHEAIAEGR